MKTKYFPLKIVACFLSLISTQTLTIGGGIVESVHGHVFLLPSFYEGQPGLQVLPDMKVFVVSADTKITVDGKKRAFKALTEEMEATVYFQQADENLYFALSIVATHRSPKPSPVPAATESPSPTASPGSK